MFISVTPGRHLCAVALTPHETGRSVEFVFSEVRPSHERRPSFVQNEFLGLSGRAVGCGGGMGSVAAGASAAFAAIVFASPIANTAGTEEKRIWRRCSEEIGEG